MTVSNAAVKQTETKLLYYNSCTRRRKEIRQLNLDEKAIGSFEGISAVIPTKSLELQLLTQGKVGNLVTLTADIGVKQAGVPVTFNVKHNWIYLNKDQVVEAVTNANGIATYLLHTICTDGDDVAVATQQVLQQYVALLLYTGVLTQFLTS